MMRWMLGLFGSCLCFGSALATPIFLDLSRVVNTAREDDGIARNGAGGWSDEGINDMGIYPPIPVGEVERNGHRFTLVDPAGNAGQAVLMLKGARAGLDKPERVEIPVPGLQGAYLVIVQNAVGSVRGQPPEYVVANWTVQYADGSAVQIPMRSQVEIRDWWCGQWWDNHGAESWPVFMGRNSYSQKYNQYIGVWATQWPNPKPELAITNLVIQSAGLAAPVLWAVTFTDENAHAGEFIKKDFVRPPGVPEDFFLARTAQERQAILAAAIGEGRLQGLRGVEVIRPDLLRVELDSAWGGMGPGPGGALAESLQRASNFMVSGRTVEAVNRHSYEAWRGDIGPFPANTLYHHALYLKLDAPLQAGQRYTVRVEPIAEGLVREQTLVFDPAALPTRAIKVNQVAYSSRAPSRYAYLGWWAGDGGAVDYSSVERYEVVEEKGGRVVAEGKPVLRAGQDERSGEQVWEIDLAAVPPGPAYHVRIPGLGRSASFAVGGSALRDLYYHTLRAFYHQRCGQELKPPYSEFIRPACHREVYAGGYLVGNPQYLPKPGEAVREFEGGYHDAADNDCFTYHLRATAQALTAYEQYAAAFRDADLNLPESGNGIPDLLDEAWWALDFYRRNQQEDGGILKGRGNDEDALRDWERQHKSRPPFGNFPPTRQSCTEYAAVAAQLAPLLRPYDAGRADALVASAERALDWSLRPSSQEPDPSDGLFEAWAAAELFNATGRERFNALVLDRAATGVFKRIDWKLSAFANLFRWAYARSSQPAADAKLQDELRAAIRASADQVVRHTATNMYRNGHNGKAGLGWGNGNGGGHYADACLRAYWLSGEPSYLQAASWNTDFQLGANPLSKTFITGLGARPPIQPQINEVLYTEPKKSGQTVKGITIYGLGGKPADFPADVPLYRCWRDIGASAEINSEFTITETIGASAILYAALYAEEQGVQPLFPGRTGPKAELK